MQLSLDAHIQPSGQVLSREVGDEVVLMSLATDAYFGLDGTGKRIWQLLAEGHSVGDTIESLATEYTVQNERVEEDVLALLTELVSVGLVEVIPPEG
jgi:hypothetical protein